jgi:2'-5' RNA ligase
MYFLAIVCPAELENEVQKHKQWLQKNFGCANALKSPAHITLIPPFWWRSDDENVLRLWLNNFTPFDPFTIALNALNTFGKNVLFINVLPSDKLNELQSNIQQHFELQSGRQIKPGNRPFHPHITLATRDIRPGDLEKAKAYLADKIAYMKFECKNISLLKLTEGRWKTLDALV